METWGSGVNKVADGGYHLIRMEITWVLHALRDRPHDGREQGEAAGQFPRRSFRLRVKQDQHPIKPGSQEIELRDLGICEGGSQGTHRPESFPTSVEIHLESIQRTLHDHQYVPLL